MKHISLFVMVLGLSLISISKDVRSEICRDGDMRNLINSLGITNVMEDNMRIFKELSLCSQEAVKALIDEMHVIPDTTIYTDEVEQHYDVMHVVWCLRALRYLTNGLDFPSNITCKMLSTQVDKRWYFLLNRYRDSVSFFGVWMSRDIIYIASAKIQYDIIQKWRKWYYENGDIFKYEQAESIDQWYF